MVFFVRITVNQSHLRPICKSTKFNPKIQRTIYSINFQQLRLHVLDFIRTVVMSHHKIYVVDDWVSIVIAILLCYISAWVGFLIIKNHKFYYAYWLKLYYFFLTAFLVWLNFLLFTRFNCYISLLYPLLGIAVVETARLQYKWIVMVLADNLRIKFFKKSIYYVGN